MCNHLDRILACDRQTDRQISFHGIVCTMHMHYVVKTGRNMSWVMIKPIMCYIQFLLCDAMHRMDYARYYAWHGLCHRKMSVHPSSVRHMPLLCQNGYMYPQTFSPLVRVRRVATPFWFLHTKRFGTIPTGTLLLGAPNEGV